ncbi:hypothetical protein LIER_44164 [Lithospermum erythrorhizon]|uniref:Uncharacterized protein n=1 Tax=Lithospermum erythrorhizon TaxID=34254 RepID=A0AAV3RBB7_LITER
MVDYGRLCRPFLFLYPTTQSIEVDAHAGRELMNTSLLPCFVGEKGQSAVFPPHDVSPLVTKSPRTRSLHVHASGSALEARPSSSR